MTEALLITDLLDLDMENEKLTFSMGVPLGYLSAICGFLRLLSAPTDSFSNSTISFDIFFLQSSMIPTKVPRAPFVSPSDVSML